jgi:predicted RNase H-like HicB family nuclease
MKLQALIHPAKCGYWAEIHSLPGCVSEGESLDEVKAHIREAVEGGWKSPD